MIFHPDTDQRTLVADAFSRPLGDLLPLSRLHMEGAGEPWDALAQLGIFGITADPDIGGVGLGMAEQALLAIELGRKLASTQILATIMAVHLADDNLASRLIAGEVRVAPALGRCDDVVVVDPAGASFLLLRSLGNAKLVPIEAGLCSATLDQHHWSVPIEQVQLVALNSGWAAKDALLRIRLVEAAALSGIAICASEMAVAYAGIREQFGRQIGAFQAVKHHCANMATAARAAQDLVTFAAVALDQNRPDAALQVESALLLAIDAALGNSRLNVQVHGGMGFSDEADPHLAVKRAHLLAEAAGGGEAAAERVASADFQLAA